MKDCKFTVTVDGKKVVYDYDGFRYFLMQKGNLAKVAPEFAGASPLPKSERQPPAAMAEPTPGIDELDLYKKPEGLVEDPSKTPPPKPSKYKTGPEARAGLLEMDKQLEQEGLRLHRALIAARTPLTTVSRKRTQAEQDQLEKDFRQAQRAFYSLAIDRRLALIDAIAPGGMADITWNNLFLQDKKVVTGFYESVVPVESELKDPAASAAIQRGVDFFRRIVGDHPDLKGATVTVRYHPQSNERAHFRPGRISYPQTGGGVKHVTAGNVLLAGADIHSWVIVHELGHWLEHLSDATLKRVIEFLKRRAGNELVRPFNTMGTGRTFDDLEVGVKDDFKDPYVGKYYGPNRRNFAGGKQGVANWDTVYGSEVISMGVEYLYGDPVKFAKDDPDYFDFMFDILRMGR
jgi:hypothetical protein